MEEISFEEALKRLSEMECVTVPWHEALKWMHDNKGEKCKVAWSDKPTKFIPYTWAEGLTCFTIWPDFVNATWQIPKESA